MRLLLAAVTLLSMVSASGSALASEGVEHTPIAKQWYGWQVLAADATTITTTVLLAGDSRGKELAQYNLIGGYLLGGPIIHLAHNNPGAAAGSIMIRAAMPVAGAFLGCDAHGPGDYDGFGCLPGAVLGGLIGMIGATTIDAAAFSYADVKPKPKSFEVLPTAGVNATGATFGLQGVF